MVRRSLKGMGGLTVAAGLAALLGLAGPTARADEPAGKSQTKPASWVSVGSYVSQAAVMLLPLPPKPQKPPKPEKPGGVKPSKTSPIPPTTSELTSFPHALDTPTIPDLPPVSEPPTTPPTTQEVPEPATLVMGLVGLGVAGAAILRRRLKKSSSSDA